jgi:hypothetical protein
MTVKQIGSTEPVAFDNGTFHHYGQPGRSRARPAQRPRETFQSLDRPLLDEPPPADWDAEELALGKPL